MGHISNYVRVLKAKLQDVFVIDSTDNNVTTTKSVTVEQIGDAICGEQVHATLETDDQTIIGGINENKDKVGDLSTLTTTDKSSLVKAINEIATYTPVYGNTASGSIATFDTSLALPLQDCTIAINAVQEAGTPSPSSPKLISGFTGANVTRCGKNLFDYTQLTSASGWTERGGVYSGTIANLYQYAMNGFPIQPKWVTNQQYVFKLKVNNAEGYALFRFVYTDNTYTDLTIRPINTGNYVSVVTTINKTVSNLFFTYYTGGNLSISEMCLELGTSASTFEAYDGHTTAITWQSEAGTVYGGSLDVTTGVLTVTHGIITFDGSGDEIWNDGTIRYSIQIPDCKRTAGRLEVLCNRGVYASSGGSEGTVFATNTFFYYYQPTSITSLADFKTWLGSNNLVVVYPLATPVTYQLTPTQISAIVGTNNVFTDTNGDTTLEYYTGKTVKDAIDEVNDKADTNATAIGSLSALTTTDKSSLVGAVNEVVTNKQNKLSYKEYVVQIGTSLWNGVYYAETNVATDVSNYGEILSALVIDESEQSDFSSHTNRACFCQVITPNVIRLYSPQASNASGHYVKYRVVFGGNAINRT